ncbi:MAG: VCBS repeat-containing protein [Acidobacteria bacterium]|nr:VCBS repeat-containing protein [Acidobacteriota bacterium]
MRNCLTLLLTLMLLVPAIQAETGIWTTNGPFGGLILDTAVDYQTPNVVYAASFGGGVFKSANWGRTWFAVNTGLTDPDVMSLVIHPVHHETLFAGTGSEGVFKSTDGGKTWFSVNDGLSGTEFYALAINPRYPNVMYAGNLSFGGGIYKSVNGGDSWTFSSTGLTSEYITSLTIHPETTSLMFAGTHDQGVFRSADAGATWTPVNNGLAHTSVWAVLTDPRDPQVVYAGSEGGVYKTSDGGDSWVNVTSGPFAGTILDLAFAAESYDTLYAAGWSGVGRTSDGGASWEFTNNNLTRIGIFCLGVDSREPGTLYAGSWGDGMYRTADGGGHWIATSTGLSGTRVNCLVLDPRMDQTAYAGIVGGVYRTRDAGRSWFSCPTIHGQNVLALAIDPDTPERLYAGTLSSLFRSTDGGDTWATAATGLPQQYVRSVVVNPAAPQVLYTGVSAHGTVEAVVYKSVDGGDTWQPSGAGLPAKNVMVIAVSPLDCRVLYAGLWGGGVYKSLDAGNAWFEANNGIPNLEPVALAVHPQTDGVVYVGTNGNGVYKTINGGESWFAVNTGLTDLLVNSLAIDPLQPEVLLAGTYNHCYRTENGGASWAPLSPVFEEALVPGVALGRHTPRTDYVGTGGGVFASSENSDMVQVYYRAPATVGVDDTLASQILPAASLVIAPGPDSLPDVSPAEPALIEIGLPPGVLLSQTLATGDLADFDLQPAGKYLPPLAVAEFGFDRAASTYKPVAGTFANPELGPQAVQLFRYVAGEDRIWIRLTQSTSDWTAGTAGNFLAFAIGLGAGVWPPTENSNWGVTGLYRQENSQFFADLRDYDTASKEGDFPVTVQVLSQTTGQPLSVPVEPDAVNLFQLDPGQAVDLYPGLQAGAVITDFTTADLDGDGGEDIVTIDGERGRLFWSLRLRDDLSDQRWWRDFPGSRLVTVEATEFTGDGRPDLLVTDTAGSLHLIPWENLWGIGKSAAAPVPERTIAVPGTVTASIMQDVDGDGAKDYVYTDSDANSLNVTHGQAFSLTESTPSGVGPVALAAGDFNGDTWPDVAVANDVAGSVSVFLNDGTGQWTRQDYAYSGSQPADIETADFDRDNHADLALALAGSKSVTVWKSAATGAFSPAQGQTLYFQNPPSAIQAGNFDGLHGPDLLVAFADYHKLALCLSDATGQLSYAYSINTLGDLELDAYNHLTLTENNVLSVAGGTGFGGVCSISGVAAIADQPFNLVHFPRSRDLSFSIVNLDEKTALLNLELYDDDGTLQQHVTATVEPDRQFARYLTDSQLLGAAADHPRRWARAFVTQADTYGFWLANESSTLTYLDGLPLPDIRDAGTVFVLPETPVGGGDQVQVTLINPAQNPAAVRVMRVGGGQELASWSLTLAGRARQVFDVAVRFPGIGADEFLLVQSDTPIVADELFGDEERLAALAALPFTTSVTWLCCPHVAVGDLGAEYETSLSLVNAMAQAMTLDLYLLDEDGIPLAQRLDLPLGGWSKVRLDVAQLFGLTQPTTGHLLVLSDEAALFGGTVTFGEADDGRFMSSLPLLSEAGGRFLVGHIANGTMGGMTFFTGVSIVNLNEATRSVRLTAYHQDGYQLAQTTMDVAGRGREIFLLDDRLTGLTDIFGGYLIVETVSSPTDDLLVFALFGNSTLEFLSAVAARKLE